MIFFFNTHPGRGRTTLAGGEGEDILLTFVKLLVCTKFCCKIKNISLNPYFNPVVDMAIKQN